MFAIKIGQIEKSRDFLIWFLLVGWYRVNKKKLGKMKKLPPAVIQFATIIACNILTFSFGLSNFWPTINLLELASENSTFATGPLTHHELSTIIAIGNVGSLLGNFIILPISETIGVKYSIHLLCVPMLVRIQSTQSNEIIHNV